MNVLFISAGPIEWGSSRMRVYWVVEALQAMGHNAQVALYSDVVACPDRYEGFGAYVWQKLVSRDIVARYAGHHWWDVCDPSWWWQPNQCRDIADVMHGVVASSEALAEDFNDWYGAETAVCIPDRLKLSHFHTQRIHQDVSPVRFIWFGVAVNRISLYGALANLERLAANGHKIELTVFDNRPDIRLDFTDAFPIYHVLWDLQHEVDVIASHDVALLPPYPGAWGKVKSNNKYLTAWACGLPVVSGESYNHLLNRISGEKYRQSIADSNLDGLQKYHNVSQSAMEWEKLLT